MIARAAPHPWLAWRQMQDITINLYHMMDFGNRRFTARIANTGKSSTPWTSLFLLRRASRSCDSGGLELRL